MDKESPPRIAYLDVAKGMDILLVILGHNSVKASTPGMEKFIFSFHWIARRPRRLLALLTYFGQIMIVLLIFHQPAQHILFDKMMRLTDLPFWAGLVAFGGSVGVPVLVHQWILKDNPRLASWFDLRPSLIPLLKQRLESFA